MVLLAGMSGVASAKIGEPLRAFLQSAFSPVPSLPELPAGARRAFEEYVHGEPVAAPGKPYEATDAISSESLPRRRLVLAGTAPHISFVMYEHGGRGRHDHLVVMMDDGDDATVAYACVGSLPRTLERLKAAVRDRSCTRDKGAQELR